MTPAGLDQSQLRRINVAAIAVILAVFIAVIVTLTVEMRQRLDVLTEANSDSVQWVLAQLEVEVVLMEMQAGEPEVDLDLLRERFDIFYSRITTLKESLQFAGLRSLPDFAEPMAEITDFLDSNIHVIDGPDEALRAAAPGMARDLAWLHQGARRMSLAGVAFFAEQSDEQRLAVASRLRGLAMMVTLLVAALVLLLLAMLRLYALSRRQAEENRITSSRLNTIVSTSFDAIVVSDRDSRVIEMNPAAEAMFGYSRDDLVGRVISEHILSPEDLERTMARVTTLLDGPDKAGRIELEAMHLNGSRFPVDVSLASTESSTGELIVSVVRDISERRKAEHDLMAALDQARAGEHAKAEFLAVMSHEMRTPLNGMIGSTEILAATELTARQKDLVDVIETSAHLLLHHVNAVLDISRAEAGAPVGPAVGFNLEVLVGEVAANQRGLAEAAGTRIEIVTVGDPLGRVIGNPGHLRQVLLNLVGNAVKFTQDGTITVEIEPLPSSDGRRWIEFRVIDDGIGIAEADLARVFDDFVMLDPAYGRLAGGTGLGLGISRRLVMALGGTIGVESERGAGSVFWVRLPLATEAPAVPQLLPAPATPEGGQPLSVLVVDDNAINRFVLRRLLDEIGHQVAEAIDGPTGVAMASATAFDLVLMDISMPGMDGIEAARRIRLGNGASRGARIAAVTAHAQPTERQRFREAGMEDCLVKPITRGALMILLRPDDALAEDGPADAPPLVDRAQIADLETQLGPDATHELIGRFLAEGDAALARLSAGLPDDEARQLCHRLAGSAATFGATALAARLIAAEAGFAAGLPPPGGTAALAALWVRTRSEVAARLPGVPRAAE